MSRAIGPFTALLFVYEPVACDAGHSTAKNIHLKQLLRFHCLMPVKIKEVDSCGSLKVDTRFISSYYKKIKS